MGFLHKSNRKVNMRKYFKSILFLIAVSIKTNMLSNSSPNVLSTSNSIADKQLLNNYNIDRRLITNFPDRGNWEYKMEQDKAICRQHGNCNESHSDAVKALLD